MIDPLQGRAYKIRYIGGSLYTNQEYETVATFIKTSKEYNKYIFVRDLQQDAKYWFVYVEQKNIIELKENIEIESAIIDSLLLYVLKSNTFFTTSINKQSHTSLVEHYRIENFMHNYYTPETGEGYLEALDHWNLRNPRKP